LRFRRALVDRVIAPSLNHIAESLSDPLIVPAGHGGCAETLA
jgi:hypothetical protein